MKQISQQGTLFTLQDAGSQILHDTLPPAVYAVSYNDKIGYYLQQTDPFPPIGKVYGNVTTTASRIMNTYKSRPASTGVLLTGKKGAGKTLLSKQLAHDCIADGMPVLLVNNSHCGDKFNQFIQNLNQPALVIFDEFEKVYDNKEQEQLLTLLDGVYTSRKLFVLTANRADLLDDNLILRPGRIFYHLDYAGLDEQFIRDYCADNLKDLSKVGTLCNLATLYSTFTFDILKAIVEEMNRYGESPLDAIKMLNCKPDNDSRYVKYDSFLKIDGVEVPLSRYVPEYVNGIPGSHDIDLVVYGVDVAEGESDIPPVADGINHTITAQDLVLFNPAKGEFVFKCVSKDGNRIEMTFTRRAPKSLARGYEAFL